MSNTLHSLNNVCCAAFEQGTESPAAPDGSGHLLSLWNSCDLKQHAAETAVLKVKEKLELELNMFIWHLTGAILN